MNTATVTQVKSDGLPATESEVIRDDEKEAEEPYGIEADIYYLYG